MQVDHLKRYYSLLQIKDFLLSKRLAEKCGTKTVSIIYLYGTADECKECREQGDVLTYLRKTYPDLRVYAFDSNLDLSAIKTLLSIYKVQGQLPSLIVDGEVYYGYKSKEELIALLPKSLKTKEQIDAENTTDTQATSTVKKILNQAIR
jgi:hypothetical protein